MLISAEVRWFWEGDCPDHISRWFEVLSFPFPASGEEQRIDRYLDLGGNTEIGVKQRGAKPELEVKGLVATIPSQPATGAPQQLWCKWDAVLPATVFIETKKTRRLRKFAFDRGQVSQLELRAGECWADKSPLPETGCNLEITRIEPAGREIWYSIGFEAFGDLQTAPAALAATLEHLQPLPDFDGMLASYPQWLAMLANAPAP